MSERDALVAIGAQAMRREVQDWAQRLGLRCPCCGTPYQVETGETKITAGHNTCSARIPTTADVLRRLSCA
mgnify:CR=1 FL=1